MAEKLIRIATPREVHDFAQVSPQEVGERLRRQGFELGDLTLSHHFLHMEESSLGYSTTHHTKCMTVGGMNFRDYLDALNDLVELFKAHPENPAFLLTSPELYAASEGDLLYRTLVDELGYEVERALTLEQRREQEQDESELVEKAG